MKLLQVLGFVAFVGLVNINASNIKGNIIFHEDVMSYQQYKLSEVSGIKYKKIDKNIMEVTLLISGHYINVGKMKKSDFIKLEKVLKNKK